eukprot:gnl/TRDRNA2_/TRDRNA2_101974_c1_seq1.p1 gnl/TRDRNA2_/TRDRNA2_101974_c1~~gnl/TRDRNA2_/TRDRNA2_101974_c1_seq1.p1  ORF type:complete len:362 (-),score=49.55 gnl/TRDRNA2_/TRDRNA2_101974_c1_seq1:32-994(-)
MAKMPEATYSYLLIDVLDTLESSIRELAAMNGIQTQEADRNLQFHAGFLASKESDHEADHDRRVAEQVFYADVFGVGLNEANKSRNTATTTLRDVLERYRLPPCIDMVDIDIQGNEYPMSDGRKGLFADKDTIELLTSRVKRVHIGLHKGADHDNQLLRQFVEHHWRIEWYFPMNGLFTGRYTDTPWGPVQTADGILGAVNMNDIEACRVQNPNASQAQAVDATVVAQPAQAQECAPCEVAQAPQSQANFTCNCKCQCDVAAPPACPAREQMPAAIPQAVHHPDTGLLLALCSLSGFLLGGLLWPGIDSLRRRMGAAATK